ncbi:MAG: efflux RND transporter permease subunit [Candidatus Gracilibacteria bacterium]|nr:efflux RND transporter permease subunit [Candidatus Gracilibacteria bacterium]
MINLNSFFTFWVKNTRTSFLIIFLILVSGVFSLYTIPKESSPDIKFGIINIVVTYSGVDPVTMDSLITEKIENEIEDIDGIKKITSSSSVGTSVVTVELDTGIDTRDTMTDIRDKLDRVSFPEDASDPVVVEISANNTLIYEALLYGDENIFDEFTLTQKAKLIKSKLEGKNGISDIEIGGLDNLNWGSSGMKSADYEIKVLLDKSKVELLGLSVPEIVSSIKTNNKDVPIGNFELGDLSYDFRFEGELTSLDDLKEVIVKQDTYSKVMLKDIAEFKLEYPGGDINKIGFFSKNGYNYVSIVFNKSTGANVFDASRESKTALEKLISEDKQFQGLGVEYSKDMSEAIIKDYENLSSTALSTIVLVFITIMFFVGLREGIIASLLIPLAFMITFIVLDLLGLSLNFLTNFSLVLTLGIAIDTVIVIIEGASEKMKLGFHRKTAILMAIRDFKSPLISGTATTLAAFLPLMFLPGIVGKFLSYIPITVFSTLLAALVLSLTLSSAIFVKFMKSKPYFYRDKKSEKNLREEDKENLIIDRDEKEERLHEQFTLRERFLNFVGVYYEKLLYNVLTKISYKLSFIFIPFILLILTFVFLSPRIGFVLFPSSDESIINIDIKGQSGLSEDYMIQFVPYIDESFESLEEIKVYYTKISNNSISIYVDLIDRDLRKDRGLMNVFQVESFLDEKLGVLRSEGLDVSVAALKGGPPTGSAVGIKLKSDSAQNFDLLKEVTLDFEKYLEVLKGAKNITTSSSDSPGQFVFQFDKEKLSNVGLNQDDILSQVYFFTNPLKAGSIKSSLEDNEIVVLYKDFEETLNPDDVENIIVNTKIGKIRVGDFANFEFKKAVNSITRENGDVVISVGSDVEDGYLPTQIQPLLDMFAQDYNYPEGISYIKSGESEENKDLIISTIQSFFIAVFLIFSILVFQFNSFRQPLIVLYSIFLALFGVNVGLFLTGNPYSMTFGIGFIALTGVVVNDAIILIDRLNKGIQYTESHIKGKINYIEQIIIAGKSRLQPIIVTTLTTIFGILPLALQDEFWAGLGFTIIFGLFVGSSMTLLVTPALYQILVLRNKLK